MFQVFAVDPRRDNRDAIVGSNLNPVGVKHRLKATAQEEAKKLARMECEQSERWFFVKEVDEDEKEDAMHTQTITLRFLVLFKGDTIVREHTREVPVEYVIDYVRGYVNAACDYNRYGRWVLINPTPDQETEMRRVAQENAENGRKPIYPFTEVDQRQFAEAYGDV